MTTFIQPAFWSRASASGPQHVAVSIATAPTAEPLTYGEAKDFLRLANNDDEAYVSSLITRARQMVESDTGLLLMPQTWDLLLEAFPSDAIRCPLEPLRSVTSITTTSVAGLASVLAATNYQVDIASSPPRIVLSDAGAWPTDIRVTQGIAIRCACGYANAAAIPAALIGAMELLIRVYYVDRSGTGAGLVLPPKWLGYDAMLAPYRRIGVA